MKLELNQQILLALAKATTGANAHDVGEFTCQYQYACEKGNEKVATAWERAFNAFLSGRITPLRKAVAEIRYAGLPPLYSNTEWWEQGR